jgi:hypothetical protein
MTQRYKALWSKGRSGLIGLALVVPAALLVVERIRIRRAHRAYGASS